MIRSATKLSYANAQAVIEGKTLGDVPVIPEHDAAAIAHDVKVLESRGIDEQRSPVDRKGIGQVLDDRA